MAGKTNNEKESTMDAAALIAVYVELVAFIQSLHVSFDHFHLSPCGGCGMPSFQQPCPLCGYYPMGNDPVERKRCQDQKITEERWIKTVDAFGVLAWYVNGSCRNTVAWSSASPLWIQWRKEMEALIASSKTQTNLPDARTILAAVKALEAEEKADRNKSWDERMKRYHQIKDRAKQLCKERGEDWNEYARRQGYGKTEPPAYRNPSVDELLEAERGINEYEP